ncbi:hypothetical protein F0344_27695 [Streptomyces finlayi]|uniref:Lipoprotein n=1 Tax=Streptomyces finlayi TaxID=67296 RepID=A0A7G7BRA9_9ACTN|nr:hypothetical protein [Streptomyces finlayi]QNE77874.1 hypothetical protein F0344_27695 [Streptomyces finlayi]
MAVHRRGAVRERTRARRAAGAVLAGLLLASACASPRDPARDTAAQEIRATLDRRATAVLNHDPAGFLAVLAPEAAALRAAQRTELANLADVPLKSWSYEVRTVTPHGTGRATADVDLRYRIDGYDRAPVSAARTLELARDDTDGRWYIAADRPGKGAASQLWQQGDVQVVRGTHSLVLGVGRPDGELRGVAHTADRAVPAVSAAWPDSWVRRVVVLVPDSVEDMAGLLGSPAASYRGIAAVTTGEVGGSGKAPGAADRVIVNPQAYALLGTFGQQIVLTHETTHVASRVDTSPATPVWLSEGFADWVAYRDEDRPAGLVAPELADAVRDGEVPAALPVDADFGFGGDAAKLARAYEGGWLACELIEDRWGEEKLIAFYKAVGGHPGRDGAVERALHTVLGTNPQEFAASWRDYLAARLG